MISHKTKIANDFGKASITYDENSCLQKQVASRLFSLSKENFVNSSILDLGCGTGYLNKLLSSANLNNEVISLDLSYQMCRHTKNKYGLKNSIQADIEDTPFKDKSIDNIFSSLAIQWCDLDRTLYEIKRIFSNRGITSFSTLGEGTLLELEKSSSEMEKPLQIVKFITKEKLEHTLKNYGFNNYSITTEKITLNYKDIFSLIKSIKSIGASYKSTGDNIYLGKDYFNQLNKEYKKLYSNKTNIYASWNVFYVTSCIK